MLKSGLLRPVVVLLLIVAVFCQGTWALAGTTGQLSGVVTESGTATPVANGQVTASSPSQQVSTQTDATGHFTFASLAPDTYDVSVTKVGYKRTSQGGISVFADQQQTLALTVFKETLTEIGTVSSRVSSDLVKAGTTADVYSVNAAMQDKVSALGGGGSLNSAYSAIASVPGAFVPLGQTGYFQTVHIRGGDYDQVGYELDGVPVNRSFDNYPSGAASSLGQQELQVYTGASPATSEGQGLAGYINQVIRTGTYPGFGSLDFGIGAPEFYHKIAGQAGGATPNRNFSYYIGLGGYNQEFRYVDRQNASSYSDLSAPAAQLADPTADPATGICSNAQSAFSSCYANVINNGGGPGPGGYQLFPYQYGALSGIADRDVVANIHVAIPHRNNSGKDDIQLLYDSGYLHNTFYSSTNDAGGPGFYGGAPPAFADGFSYSGAPGVALPANYSNLISNYLYPSSPSARAYGATIPLNARDVFHNTQGVVKLSYQKNFSSEAFLRVYGYSYYSDWLNYGPNGANLTYIGTGASPDYELNAHTRGVSAQFTDQINSKNLFTVQGSYVNSTTLRDNNTQMFNGSGKRSRFAVLTDPAAINNPSSPNYGICYAYNGPGAATPASCDSTAPGSIRGTYLSYGCAQTATCAVSPATASSANCGSGPCTYYVDENGLYATYNTVKPTFSALSMTDNFRPSDRLLVNFGLRQDTYTFEGSSTSPQDPARQFFFAAFNKENCQNTQTGAPASRYNLGIAPGTPCSTAGAQYRDLSAANGNQLLNASGQKSSYNVFQPRFGGTYTFNPDTVVRFSAGKYAEPPNAAFEQYNTLQENLPALLGGAFYKFGFFTPGHAVTPPISYNYDLSLEKHLKGTDWSFKITPFLRKTKGQIQQFFLDQATAFSSGLNVGRQTSEGVEFQLNKGDFSRNGLAGSLAFTYTNSFIQYDTLSNGTSVVSGINADVKAYDAYTKGCAATYLAAAGASPASNSNPQCGVLPGGANSAPCFTATPLGTPAAAGIPDPTCAPGDIGNPYWNAPIATGLDPAAKYPTYGLFPGPIGSSAQAFGAPFLATLILNYKHDRFTLTPSMQFQGGARYGAPETTPGIDPGAGCSPLAVQPPSDTRSGYVNPGPAYDATTCNSVLNAIPNIYTGKFDTLGTFRQPSQINVNVQVAYAASNRVSFVGTFANLVNRCFGGSSAPGTLNDGNVCSYGTINNAGAFAPVGNVYNPGTPIQRLVRYPYGAYLASVNDNTSSIKTPFNFFLEARIKL
ncbi:MAG: TonB-dependent receptor [Candidatus Eremiobacteraeota bacterium]|nr:TonB-dependent receptor [Candidatus Eremiobacteraeota bacterium]